MTARSTEKPAFQLLDEPWIKCIDLQGDTRILSLDPPMSGENRFHGDAASYFPEWTVLGSLVSPALHPYCPLVVCRVFLSVPASHPFQGLDGHGVAGVGGLSVLFHSV